MHAYKDYGGRGIKVCKRWDNYNVFASDMGPHPGKGWSIDRKNNNGNYCKSNCRWATTKTQMRNRRATKLNMKKAKDIRAIYARGGISQEKLGAQFGVHQMTVSGIIRMVRWL